MPQIRAVANDRRKPESTYLLKGMRNVHSQTGEDGVIEQIFSIIGAGSKWCVEFGAWDGLYLSNTCNLIKNHQWSGVMIEGNGEKCAEIKANYSERDTVYPMNEMVGFRKGVDTIDDILQKTPIPKEFDFISIDVDGIDWHIWESIVEYRPRVVAIEFNPSIPNSVSFVQDRDMGIKEGSSLLSFIELGKKKGYELVAVTNYNAFFVVENEFSKFSIEDNSADAMRVDRANYIFCGYNGKIYQTMSRLSWSGRHVDLKPDGLQLLAVHARARLQDEAQTVAAAPSSGPFNLKTADGIVRELQYIRGHRATMTDEDYKRRTRDAWVAAKTYTDQHMPWIEQPPGSHETVLID